MTTDSNSDTSRAADRSLLQLIDEALEREPASALEWLLAQLPSAEHERAQRLFLAASESTDDMLESTALIVDAIAPWVGRRIGPYKLASLIGEGGMGQVFLADRVDGEFSQRVAVKVIRNGSLTDKAIAQFQSERQILADLSHPNIAGLLDGGTTDEGLPYVVMENVVGEPLDVYIEAHDIPLNGRLHLFADICAAVDYAHRSLVIHRDIKPSNILVTSQGIAKLLDFGIAKSIAPDDMQTTLDGRSLTPSYASPEQVRGVALTTATDVYSLGIVLYQCLTGERPYETSSLTPAEYEQVVTEKIPERPSIRLKEQRNAGWSQLSGDLDAIVMRALAKEPERRYASAAALADDIKRYLAHLPVSAQPDSALYRLGRFVRRRRGWVAAGGVVALLLSAAYGLTVRQYQIAVAERERADQRFEQARTLAQSMFYDVYDILADVQGTLVARETLAEKGVVYLDELSKDPTATDDLLLDLGKQYSRLSDVYGGLGIANLGEIETSWSLLLKAETMIATLLERTPQNVAAVSEMLWIKRLKTNQLLTYQLDSASARTEILSALAAADKVRAQLPQPNWPLESRYWNARTDFIKVLIAENDHATALAALNDYLEELANPDLEGKLRNVPGKRSYFRSQRAEIHLDAGRFADGLPDWHAAYDHVSEIHRENPEVSFFMIQRQRYAYSLARSYNGLANYSKALEYADIALGSTRRLLELDPDDKGALRNLGAPHEARAQAFAGMGQFAQAMQALAEAETVYVALLEALPEEPLHQRDMANLRFLQGRAQLDSGAVTEGCALLAESQTRWQELLDKQQITQYDRAGSYANLSDALQADCPQG